MLLTVLAAVVYLACLGFFIWALATAPAGYEDTDGFHLGDGADEYVDRPMARRVSLRPKSRRHADRGHRVRA